MPSQTEQVLDVLSHDVDAEFLEEVCIEVGWAYSRLFDDLNSQAHLTPELKMEQFALRRGTSVVSALIGVAQRRGVPFNFRTLACNGQQKLLIKMGRVVLIQEPILTSSDAPRAADYKVELAESHGVISQLELDLGDDINRIMDWSGSVFAVLLHGAYGKGFSREERALGAIELAVPTSTYHDWVMRLDLRNTAMFGLNAQRDAPASPAPEAGQIDKVNIRVRREAKRKSTGTTK